MLGPPLLRDRGSRAQIPWLMTFYLISPIVNDLDQQNANEDGPDVYKDDVFDDKGELLVKYYKSYSVELICRTCQLFNNIFLS